MYVVRSFEVWLSSREAIGGSWSEATQLTDFGCVPTDWAPDGNGIREDGSEGIWAIPPQGGEPSLVVAYDDADIEGGFFFSVGRDHLYVTVPEHESDIWVMDVEVER